MRIGFLGPQGSGKTTLVKEMLKMSRFKDYKRYTNIQRTLHNYLGDKFPHSSKTNNISQSSISSNFVLQLLQNENIICDRSLIDTFVYAELSENVTDSKKIEEAFSKGLELYDVIFYTPLEFAIEDDGFRDSDVNYTKLVDDCIKTYIEKYKNIVKIVTVSGTVEERLNIINKTLEG